MHSLLSTMTHSDYHLLGKEKSCHRIDGTRTKVLHFAIGKPMAHHGKFAVKRMAKSIGKLWQTQLRKTPWQKRSPASHKRMSNDGIFSFPGVKASHGLPGFFIFQINKRKMANLPLFPKILVFWILEKPQ